MITGRKRLTAGAAEGALLPATSISHQIQDNMGANFGPVPDADQRAEMLRAFNALPA